MGWKLSHGGSVLSLLKDGDGKDGEENHNLPGTLPAGKQPQTPKSMSVMKSLKPEARGVALINTRREAQEPRLELKPQIFDPARAVRDGGCLPHEVGLQLGRPHAGSLPLF